MDNKQMNVAIIVAIIGAFGMTVAAFLTSWDKILGTKPIVPPRNEYRIYKPSGNYEVELAYFLNISGQKQVIDSLLKQIFQNTINEQITKHPEPEYANYLKIY